MKAPPLAVIRATAAQENSQESPVDREVTFANGERTPEIRAFSPFSVTVC